MISRDVIRLCYSGEQHTDHGTRIEDASAPGFRLLSLLLFFVFGGAIVGETVAVSIVVSVSGMTTLGRMYMINGVLLFGLPLLFFRHIDRFRRERLLADQLLATVGLLFLYLVVYSVRATVPAAVGHALLMVIYPLSYLTKTLNFLTFWTLANDVCDTSEAKKGFPIVAAWGFAGGLMGAFGAWALLRVVDAEMVVWLWMFLYLVAWVFVKKIRNQFWARLLRPETVHVHREPMRVMVKEVLGIRLVREMSVIYFLVFVAIFSVDFLFWKQCHRWFPTAKGLASFQFSFYLAHALMTIAALYLALPNLIARVGFVKIMYALPVLLFFGSAMLLGVRIGGVEPRLLFAATILLQFLRHVVFENAFSPIYQMFFVAIPSARRGRAKTLLEGVVKPAALLGAGLYLTYLGGLELMVPTLVLVASVALVYLVFSVRRTYIEELVPRTVPVETQEEIVAGISSAADSKIVSLVREYARSNDQDLRALAVRIMTHQPTRQSLAEVTELYEHERSPVVRETIASSLAGFYWYETRQFVERLLHDDSVRVRADALVSLTAMNARWKWEFRDLAREMLFENSLRVRIGAARFLWASGDTGDRQSVRALMTALLASRNANKRSAGLYLVGALRPDDWELILLRNLTDDSPAQVFGKSVETIMASASDATRTAALERIEKLPRERIAAAGRAVELAGPVVVQAVLAFLGTPRERRMSFELVHALRVIKYAPEGFGLRFEVEPRAERNMLRWVLRELHAAYVDAAVWVRYRASAAGEHSVSGVELLESALSERVLRVAEWALDAMVLLDREGLITWGRRDLDMREYSNRLDMIEILESLGSHRIGAWTVPLLKFESWEDIARKGRFLRRRGEDRDAGLVHFARSENRWVCVCTLYAMRQTTHPERLVREHGALLERLSGDGNPHVAAAAQALCRARGSEDVETFELLETVLFLKQTPLFHSIAGERLMAVAEICEEKAYEAGTILSREGEVSDHLYIVKSGSVDIVKETGGRRRTLGRLRTGETYGEVGMFSQAQRSASAVAQESCRVYEIQRSALKKLLMRMPEIAYSFLEIFSDKLRRSGEELPQDGVAGTTVEQQSTPMTRR